MNGRRRRVNGSPGCSQTLKSSYFRTHRDARDGDHSLYKARQPDINPPVIAKLLGLPDTPGVMFLVFAGGGMIYFFSVASIAYFLYFKKFKAK